MVFVEDFFLKSAGVINEIITSRISIQRIVDPNDIIFGIFFFKSTKVLISLDTNCWVVEFHLKRVKKC